MYGFVFTLLCSISANVLQKIVNKLGLSYHNSRKLNNIIDNNMAGPPPFQCRELEIGHEHLQFFCCDAILSPARDKDSESRVRALSRGKIAYDKSHLSRGVGKERGLNHEVRLLGAREKQCIVPKDKGDSTCRSKQQAELLKYSLQRPEAVRVVR